MYCYVLPRICAVAAAISHMRCCICAAAHALVSTKYCCYYSLITLGKGVWRQKCLHWFYMCSSTTTVHLLSRLRVSRLSRSSSLSLRRPMGDLYVQYIVLVTRICVEVYALKQLREHKCDRVENLLFCLLLCCSWRLCGCRSQS